MLRLLRHDGTQLTNSPGASLRLLTTNRHVYTLLPLSARLLHALVISESVRACAMLHCRSTPGWQGLCCSTTLRFTSAAMSVSYEANVAVRCVLTDHCSADLLSAVG